MAEAEEPQGCGVPEWVVTFGDMMSLLLTFFVLLFSMSEIKQEESLAVLESLRRQFGHESAMVSPVPGRSPPLNSGMRTMASMGRAQRLSTMNGGDKVRAPVGESPRVWTIRPSGDRTLGGVVYFREGSAELDQQQEDTLRQAAEILRGKPQKIEIRGHTSTRPLEPDSPYRNHWDLAYARCMAVMDRLVKLGIEPKRIRVEVAADNEPLHVSPDPAMRKKNARVEVLLSDEMVDELRGTDEEKKQKYTDGPAG